MIIAGEKFTFDGTFETPITVADSWVMPKNKLGDGNGEAKLYVGSRDKMEAFFGAIGFTATCFVLRQDLQAYMNAIKAEYLAPSQEYRGKDEMRFLWSERMEKINALPDGIVDFTIREQSQIAGPRGYVNSSDKIYKLIREISLPLVSYISVVVRRGSPDTDVDGLFKLGFTVTYDLFKRAVGVIKDIHHVAGFSDHIRFRLQAAYLIRRLRHHVLLELTVYELFMTIVISRRRPFGRGL